MNEDTAYREGELVVAVYVKNIGDKCAKDIKVKSTIMDYFVTDEKFVAQLDSGKTKRVIFYLPVDELDPYSEFYIRSTINVDNVKKAKYSQFLLR